MERLINRRQQGDLGELSAMEWLTRQGALVFAPLGHSPDCDLVADLDGRLLRIQVKTSTQRSTTHHGHLRSPVLIATNGGNQSWTGLSKYFDPTRFDLLFILTGDGRRWLIPSEAISARKEIVLGGPKYSEFEIEPTSPIRQLLYGDESAHLESPSSGGAPELESRARL
ncbi:MAG: group I intron-associated PD-(D/E)XK endonuclease [bacterium]